MTTAPGGQGAPRDLIDAALADAHRRTGVATTAMTIVSAERVTWSDGALGCPQPGLAYTQALQAGYRIVLRVPGGLLHYHAGLRGAPFLCPADRAVQPQPSDVRR